MPQYGHTHVFVSVGFSEPHMEQKSSVEVEPQTKQVHITRGVFDGVVVGYAVSVAYGSFSPLKCSFA